MNVLISIISFYTALFFLIISRFIYNLEYPTLVKGQSGDFFLWMSHLPPAIVLAIIIPLVVSIVFKVLHLRTLNRTRSESTNEAHRNGGN